MSLKVSVKSNLRSKVRWGIVGIFALLFIASVYDAPNFFNQQIDRINNIISLGLPRVPAKPFALGLDLQGGAHLIYQADVSEIKEADRGDAVEGVRDIIERRVNGLGIGESNIQTTKIGNDYRIIVELPGITDVKQAITMIGETPILEFREQNDEPARELTPEEKTQLDTYNKDAEARASGVLGEIKKGLDFAEAAKKYSEHEASKNNGGYFGFINEAKYGPLYLWAAAAKENDVSDKLVRSEEGFNVLKRGGQKEGEEQIKASHILICYLGAASCDSPKYAKEEALAKARELFNQANAANFAELAKDNSTDPTFGVGGDLGFFSRESMIKEFADAAFNAKIGQIVGPVETEFGFHIIYKMDERKSMEYELSAILIRAKSETDILPAPEPYKYTGLTGSQLDKAEIVSDPNSGAVQVSLQFDAEGKELFKDITTRNVGKPVAIYLDGVPITIPTVQQPILDGRAVVTGDYDLAEARLLSQRLNTGALPVPVNLISQQTVGASLGAESLDKSLRAGFIAMIVIMIFMILYYRLPGALSVIALGVYLSVVLAIFKFVGVTLTLAGIAGFIMSIGIAVDANILIFERMKEELKGGRSLKFAVEEGFLRAWTSIRDSNVSTLITCFFLIWFGSSFVTGFAATLAIGVLVSMFSAITVTRIMLRFISGWFSENGNWMFLGYNKKK